MSHHAPLSPSSKSHDSRPVLDILHAKAPNDRFASTRLLRDEGVHATLSRVLFVLIVVALATLFLPWQQNVKGAGVVTALRPEDRPQVVPTVIAGRIEKWHVAEGDFVRKGAPLVEISEVKDAYLDPRTLERYGEQLRGKKSAVSAKRAKASALSEQLEALSRARDLSIEQARNKVTLYEAAVDAAMLDSTIAAAQLARNRSLFDDGLKSRTDLEAYELKAQSVTAKLVEKRRELLNARLEVAAYESSYAEKLAKATADRSGTIAEVGEGEVEVAKLDNQYASLALRNAMYRITAPQDGYVVRAIRAGIGEQLKEGEPVVTVMPAATERAVELYLKPMDIPLVRPGRKVRLQFDGWPALQFAGWPSVSVGTFGGIVQVVDLTNSPDGKYRMLVVPDPDEEPWPAQLRVGSGVLGWAMLDKVRLWFELWRTFNGFPPTIAPTSAAGGKGDKAGGGK